MFKWLKIICFVDDKTGAQSLRVQPKITCGWVATRTQVFSDVILTPLHIVPVKMLGNCLLSQRVEREVKGSPCHRNVLSRVGTSAREMATVLRVLCEAADIALQSLW